MAESFTTVANLLRAIDMGSDNWYGKGPITLAGVGTNTFTQLPIRESIKATPTVNKTEKTSEGKSRRIIISTQWEAEVKVLQVGAEELYTFPNNLIANGYSLFVCELTNKESLLPGDKWLYAAFIAELSEPPGWGSGETPTYKLAMQKATAEITIPLDLTTFPAFHGGLAFPAESDLVIASGEAWGILEV